MRFHTIIASALPLLASIASTLAWVSQLDDSDRLVSRYADDSDALESRFADYDDELSARDDGFGIDSGYDLRSLTNYELRSLTDYLDDHLEARERNSYPAAGGNRGRTHRSSTRRGDPKSAKSQARQIVANKARKDGKAAGRDRFADARKAAYTLNARSQAKHKTGLVGQTASTAGGVAVGSTVGHTTGGTKKK